MKKLITTLAFALLIMSADAQTIRRDSAGNYVAVGTVVLDSTTGKTFTDTRGQVYPVYQSVRGKLYIWRVSKTGKAYRQYLKVEGEK